MSQNNTQQFLYHYFSVGKVPNLEQCISATNTAVSGLPPLSALSVSRGGLI